MPGTSLLIGGGIAALVGVVCMLTPNTMASWPGLVGLGLIAVGVGAFMVGLFRYMAEQTGENLPNLDLDPGSEVTMTRMRIICEAMAAVAVANGKVCSSELAKFRDIHHRITGQSLPEGIICDIARQADTKSFDLEKELRAAKPILDEATRVMIVKAAHAILVADHLRDPTENEALQVIAGTLDLEIDDVLALCPTGAT